MTTLDTVFVIVTRVYDTEMASVSHLECSCIFT